MSKLFDRGFVSGLFFSAIGILLFAQIMVDAMTGQPLPWLVLIAAVTSMGAAVYDLLSWDSWRRGRQEMEELEELREATKRIEAKLMLAYLQDVGKDVKRIRELLDKEGELFPWIESNGILLTRKDQNILRDIAAALRSTDGW